MEVIINIQQIAKNLMYRIIPFYTFWYIVMQTHEIKFILFKRKEERLFRIEESLTPMTISCIFQILKR